MCIRDREYSDAMTLSFEIRFDPASANFAGITPTDGKNGTVEAVREADGLYVITVTDTGKYKDMRSGDVMFEILLRERTEGTDINSIVKSLTAVSYTHLLPLPTAFPET